MKKKLLEFTAVLMICCIFFSACSAGVETNGINIPEEELETENESKSYDLEENEEQSNTSNDYVTDNAISDESETEDLPESISESASESTEDQSQPIDETAESESGEETAKTWYLNEMEYDGVLITESTASEMTEGYDYIEDVYIEVDEVGQKINITVKIASSTDTDTAKMAGEDVARYLASQASYSTNSYRSYKAPGNDNLGSLYDRYDLLLFIDDGKGTFNIYGAKVKSSKKITWN